MARETMTPSACIKALKQSQKLDDVTIRAAIISRLIDWQKISNCFDILNILLVKCVLPFFVMHDIKLNMFGFWTGGQTKQDI